MNIHEWFRLAQNLFNQDARLHPKPEKTAKFIVVNTARGDFGFNMCGACHKVVPDNPCPDHCPHCHVRFVGSETAVYPNVPA